MEQAILPPSNLPIPEYPDYPPTYPLTVFIATKNLTTSQAGWNAVNGGYSYTYNMAPTGEQTVQFKSVQPDSREQIVISAPGFSNATIAVDNYLAANIGVSGELRAVYNGLTYTLQSRSATSSNTSIINNFTTNRSSMYNITVKSGNKLSDTVTITCYGYTGSFTVRRTAYRNAFKFISIKGRKSGMDFHYWLSERRTVQAYLQVWSFYILIHNFFTI